MVPFLKEFILRPGIMVHTWEVEARESISSKLHSKFKNGLDYIRLCLKMRERKKIIYSFWSSKQIT